MECIRQPIVATLGHVDHGKSTILDTIRHSSIVNSEAGAITQSIGASIVPIDAIRKICGDLLKTFSISIPGMLFIDTPGHAAFSTLRKRGGNIADIAILVVDINEGFKPQTIEALEILRTYKTPFVVAANKVDLLPGWRKSSKTLLESVKEQIPSVQELLDKRIYELVGKLGEYNISSERYDRIQDFASQVAIIPVSGKSGEGVPELLMTLIGLNQKFLTQELKIDMTGPAKGVVLEVKNTKGLGFVLDVILYDGCLKTGDLVAVGGLDEPILTRVKALLEPAPMREMRDTKTAFRTVPQASAATGVRIVAPHIEDAVPGMPIISYTPEQEDQAKQEVQAAVEEVLIDTEHEGIVIKADSLGSLEAMVKLLQQKSIPIRKAAIGNITKKDIAEAESNAEKHPLLSVVLGFNVENTSGLEPERVRIITHKVIYSIIDSLEAWQIEEKKRQELKALDVLVKPCKIEVLHNYVFRQSNPAIVGVHVLVGELKTGMPLMKDGQTITTVKSIQKEKESVSKAEENSEVAASLPHVTVGRQLFEGDILYSSIPEEDFRNLKKYRSYLSPKEAEVAKEIAQIMRRNNPVWGI